MRLGESPAGFFAICSCGWRSDPTLTAALAIANGDHHVTGRPDHDPPGSYEVVATDS